MRKIKLPGYTLMIPMLSLLAFLPATEAWAQPGRYGHWHMGYGMGSGMMGSWGFGWFGGIFMVVFWILILVGVIFLIRWLVQSTGKDRATGGGTNSALEILKERYARGEIEKEEFDIKKKDLS